MDIERNCLQLLLRYIKYNQIDGNCEEPVTYKRIPKNIFEHAADQIMPNYTKDEIFEIHSWFSDYLEDSQRHKDGIFSMIAEMADQFLIIDKNKFICKLYGNSANGNSRDNRSELQLLRWRELSLNLGNDLFMAVLLAKQQRIRQQLDISACLCTPFPTFDDGFKTDLKMKDLSENHFHLKGSIPVFTLNWVCMMNHIGEQSTSDFFTNFKAYLEPDYLYQDYQQATNLEQMAKLAAYDRLYLFHRINDNQYFLQKPLYQISEYDDTYLSELQKQINLIRSDIELSASKRGCLDYAISDQWLNCQRYDEVSVAGERYFLYQCFQKVFDGTFKAEDCNIFYRYIVISLRVRSELIQINQKRGFANFADYQGRKEDFIEHFPEYKNCLMKLTAKSLSDIQSLSTLEMRIVPKKTYQETLNVISEYDREGKGAKTEFFYVLHIPKYRDDEWKLLKPRNHKIRAELGRQIYEQYALLDAERSEYNELKKIPRVRGFDTCANEIGCRPEVFGEFFRSLNEYNIRYQRKQVHFTYHVGEDFLDLLDGLRAIDETILFCQMPPGSRIGHGIALGIRPESYYELKNNRSVMPKQELLDNIVWVLGFCQEHKIAIESELKKELEAESERLLEEIYEPEPINDNTGVIAAHYQAAVTREIPEYPNKLGAYYDAWKLRGDRPDYYLPDYYKKHKSAVSSTALIDSPELNYIRENSWCRQYYCDYHYDENVRSKGNKREIFVVDHRFHKLIKKIQRELITTLAERKIAVECNPTSNYCIGPFSRYQDHPMLNLYSKNLVEEDSRLNVSINTDDLGVFYTSLEMEYGIMYTALMKCRKDDHQPKYSREQILQWLADVREFGHIQAFSKEKMMVSFEKNYTHIP